MQKFSYIIKDEIGIHARPAGNIVKLIKDAKSQVKIECNGKSADAKKIFSLLLLAAKKDDEIKIEIEGEDEAEVKEMLYKYLNENL